VDVPVDRTAARRGRRHDLAPPAEAAAERRDALARRDVIQAVRADHPPAANDEIVGSTVVAGIEAIELASHRGEQLGLAPAVRKLRRRVPRDLLRHPDTGAPVDCAST